MASGAKKRINWKRQALAAERLRFEIVRNWQSNTEPVRMDLLALGVAHEFNNILGAALGHADWALESQTPEDMKDALEVIRIACLRCAQITKSLQGIVQPREEGKSIFQLKELFEETRRLWENRANKSGVKLNFEESDTRVYLDASAFMEVLSNLIKNSFEVLEKNNTKSALINIKTEVTEATVNIHYRDNGPGIPKSYRPYIFQPFFSTKGSISAVFDSEEIKETEVEVSLAPKNSGLGLFLSRALAQEMGGDLRLIDTQIGEGVHFQLSLPLVK
jgi:signal transduction histidine kinase